MRQALIVTFLFLAFTGYAKAQDSTKKPAPPPKAPAAKTTPNTKAVLLEASRVSTAKATDSAARQKAEGEETEDKQEQASDSAVTELRPVPPGSQGQSEESKSEKAKGKSKSAPLKNVHGTIHGGSGSAGEGAGGAVGATTPSGKTSVYVEGQKGRTRDPRR